MVTIVGLGAIGKAVAQRVAAFDVKTIGVRYTPDKGGLTDEVIGFDKNDFHAALAETDHLVLASPLTEMTHGLVGAEEFETLPHTHTSSTSAAAPSSTPTRWSTRSARTRSTGKVSTSWILNPSPRTTHSGDSET